MGRLPSPELPAYAVLDARWGWLVSSALQLSLSVQNLLDRAHAEWGDPANRASFGRAWIFKVVWKP